ncbi:MAG: universal stress protein [Anaerolineae bacterium]|jgi:nucleotide-binding universal stress UspA family protein|nr:universal stress protein [Anaerolineae bacterium]
MFKKILVPLDGSSFAEEALPHARELAECGGAEIILARVDEPYEPPPGIFVPATAIPEVVRLSAGEYLEQLVSRLKLAGFKVESVVLDGKVADALLKYAREEGVDLIVMSTHGRTGISRLLMGSVAEQIVHGAHCPVLLMRPQER